MRQNPVERSRGLRLTEISGGIVSCTYISWQHLNVIMLLVT